MLSISICMPTVDVSSPAITVSIWLPNFWISPSQIHAKMNRCSAASDSDLSSSALEQCACATHNRSCLSRWILQDVYEAVLLFSLALTSQCLAANSLSVTRLLTYYIVRILRPSPLLVVSLNMRNQWKSESVATPAILNGTFEVKECSNCVVDKSSD